LGQHGNELRTKRSITAIGDIAITVTVSDGIQSTDKNFTIKVVEKIGALIITTKDNFSAPKNADKVIVLAANKSGVRFFIADRKTYPTFVSSKINHLVCFFKRRNISRGNTQFYWL
jgi:hypothetical protein